MVVVDRVVVELEARTGQYERNIRNAEVTTTRGVRAMNSSVALLSNSLAGLAAGIGVKGLIDLSSAWTDLNSRVINTTGSIESGAAVIERLGQISRRTFSPLQQTADAYLRNATSLRELGYSTQEQLDLTETLNNALVVSAIRGDRARQVNEAYSKAIAQGVLRGEELNTIIQNGGRVAQALAESLGVTTNELRALGNANKITTNDLVGITSQLGQLRAEADAMPATIADAFIILQNEVLAFVGTADSATSASAMLAEQILNIANNIDTLAIRFEKGDLPVQRFLNGIMDIARAAGEATGANQIGEGIREGFDNANDSIAVTEVRLTEAEQALVNFAENGASRFGVLEPVVRDFIQQLLEGKGTIESTNVVLSELAGAGDFGPLLDGLRGLVETFLQVRDAAEAARAVTSDLGSFPSRREFNRVFPPNLNGDGRPGGPTSPPVPTTGRGGGGGGGTSPAQRFEESLTQQQRQIEVLRQETAARAQLNPLVNDYGYALERLRVQQELENELTRAGLTLTADRAAAIATLAEGMAQATVEAAKLAEEQKNVRDVTEEWAQITQSAVRSFIDDLIEGKTAAEAFGNVLQEIGSQLINMGLNSLFGGGSGGGGLLGGLFGGFRANGGPVNSGRSYIVGERGPELFTPSSAGRITSNADMQGGGVTVQMANDFRGVDPASVTRIQASLDQLATNLVPTIRKEIAVGPKKGRR